MVGSLKLTGKVMRTDLRDAAPAVPEDNDLLVQPLTVSPALTAGIGPFPVDTLRTSPGSFTPAIQAKAVEMRARIDSLFHQIQSELHSRGSFALSCLTLVLLGAALGILMRGATPCSFLSWASSRRSSWSS